MCLTLISLLLYILRKSSLAANDLITEEIQQIKDRFLLIDRLIHLQGRALILKHLPPFFIFMKGNNFCDFFIASLHMKVFQ